MAGISLAILGSGGNAYDVLDVVAALVAMDPTISVAGFLDDARPSGSTHLGLPVLGRIEDAVQHRESCRFINAVGSDRSYPSRPQITGRAGVSIDRYATLVHPGASVSRHAHLGRGVCVNFGASIAGGAVIGDHVLLGPGCIIGHNSIIEDYSVIAPGAIVSGFCQVGSAAYLGAGCSIRQQVRIGPGALVGMATVVLNDVAPNAIVVGNPARPLERTMAGPALDGQPSRRIPPSVLRSTT